jgi:hypothetical protein
MLSKRDDLILTVTLAIGLAFIIGLWTYLHAERVAIAPKWGTVAKMQQGPGKEKGLPASLQDKAPQ